MDGSVAVDMALNLQNSLLNFFVVAQSLDQSLLDQGLNRFTSEIRHGRRSIISGMFAFNSKAMPDTKKWFYPCLLNIPTHFTSRCTCKVCKGNRKQWGRTRLIHIQLYGSMNDRNNLDGVSFDTENQGHLPILLEEVQTAVPVPNTPVLLLNPSDHPQSLNFDEVDGDILFQETVAMDVDDHPTAGIGDADHDSGNEVDLELNDHVSDVDEAPQPIELQSHSPWNNLTRGLHDWATSNNISQIGMTRLMAALRDVGLGDKYYLPNKWGAVETAQRRHEEMSLGPGAVVGVSKILEFCTACWFHMFSDEDIKGGNKCDT